MRQASRLLLLDDIGSPDFAGLTRIEFTSEVMGTEYAHGDPVDSWKSITSPVIDLVNTGTARPTYKTDLDFGAGGIAGVRFDGVDDTLEAAGLALDFSAGVTVFAVLRQNFYDGSAVDGPWLGKSTGDADSASRLACWWGSSTLIRHSVNRKTTESQWRSTNAVFGLLTPMVLSARYNTGLDPADDPVYRNGVAPSGTVESNSIAGPSGTINELKLGTAWSSILWDGEIAAWVAYHGGSMTNAQVEAVHASLDSRLEAYP